MINAETGVQFPAPISRGSQTHVNPAPRANAQALSCAHTQKSAELKIIMKTNLYKVFYPQQETSQQGIKKC